MFRFIKKAISNIILNAELHELSKNDDLNKKMLGYLLNDQKTFFRLTEEEKTHLNNQIKSCSDKDFDDLKFDLGQFKNGELAYLLSCLHSNHSMAECDNAYDYICDNFPCFIERLEKIDY